MTSDDCRVTVQRLFQNFAILVKTSKKSCLTVGQRSRDLRRLSRDRSATFFTTSSSLVPRLSACVIEINEWMASNRLRLNPTKTELIWLVSARRLVHCPYDPLEIAGVWITPTSCVRDLGVMVDSDLTLVSHVNHLTSTCYYHIRQLRSIRRSLTVDTAHALARALIHSRLDYCNGVLAGLPKYQVSRLQSVLRSAAKLVLRLPGSSSILSLMRERLHWLPFPYIFV